jgi:hypothetical protein
VINFDRFQEDSGEILKLREKEKGDWKKLTLAEKKQLYRASFCQTIAEVNSQNGISEILILLNWSPSNNKMN